MRWLLFYQLMWFEPATHALAWEDHSEVHLSAYSCELAQRELYVLAKMRSWCEPMHAAPPQFGTTITRKILFGEKINGRHVSRYEREKRAAE